MKVHIHWFRRDLRLNDNTGLHHALKSDVPVVPVFIFDDEILNDFPEDDHRVNFIYDHLLRIHWKLEKLGSGVKIYHGRVEDVWKTILEDFDVASVTFNHDYEPYALDRDERVSNLLKEKGIAVSSFKDHVIFEKDEVVKADGKPYTVYTPYKRTWLKKYGEKPFQIYNSNSRLDQFYKFNTSFPSKEDLGIIPSQLPYPKINLGAMEEYHKTRDYPAVEGTTNLGVHLRFGTISPRMLVQIADQTNQTFLSEIIWRDFFSQILYHFPHVVDESFRQKYDQIEWRNDEDEFQKWCEGNTGYPMVDAGMRELNATGHMHNRVRMIVASFLCKHLLIDWRWGEAYFAQKLFDYDLASNNGNWQWAAGTGCDAAPYFRVFNPETQMRKFDPDLKYVKKWVPEFGTFDYPNPMVNHKSARLRALDVYKEGLDQIPA